MLNNFLCRLQDWMISIVLRYYTSEQATYRLLWLFPKSERAHCAASPFQIEPASLGFDLVLDAISKENRFYPLTPRRSKLHIACSDFFQSQSALIALLLLSKSNPLRWASIWFWTQSRKKIDFNPLLQRKKPVFWLNQKTGFFFYLEKGPVLLLK